MPEIDEEELRKNAQLRQTLSAIVANPKARAKLLEAQKIVNPDAAVPELDQQAKLDEALSGIQKTVSDFITEQKTERETAAKQAAEGRVRERMDREINDLRSQGVTDEGIAGVQKLMEAEGIVSPKVAWSHFERLNPPPPITTPSSFGNNWDFVSVPDGNEKLQELVKSGRPGGVVNEPIVDALIRETLNEVRAPQGRR